jgi:small subunit ribosomal protein S13
MIQKSFIKDIQKNYGIGNSKTKQFINCYGLNQRTNPRHIKKNYSDEIKKVISTSITERLLKNNIKSCITFLLENKTYRGIRHKLKYPVRGQRTRTNAKTTKKKKL